MKRHFEIYVLTDHVTTEAWRRIYKTISSQIGTVGKFELLCTFTNNVVRFYISSERDLSVLSNNLEGVVLKPTDEPITSLPRVEASERFVQLTSGGNLLDLKEKIAVKRAKHLEYVLFKIQTLGNAKAIVRATFYFQDDAREWSAASKLTSFFPAQLLDINFAANTRYLKKSLPKYLNIEKALHVLKSDQAGALFQVDTFPYLNRPYYLGLSSYDFDRHSFIVGASGSGKSKLISLFVDRLYGSPLRGQYRVVVIDPHASIAPDFRHIDSSKVVTFSGQSTKLFGDAGADVTAATELTAALFKSMMGEQYSAKTDRVLRFALFVLITAQVMSLDMLKRFVTDIDLREQILRHVSGYVPANVVQFFGTDFNELRTRYYNEAVSPLVSFVDEMQLQPALADEGELSLAKTIQENFLTVFSLNKVSMGERVVKTVAGLLIQQIFLLAQSKAFHERIILIVDEVSVVQNPTLALILAEARKFNLSVILTQQYFGQVDKDLRDAIFANVYNYYAFKVSEEDARNLEGNLRIEIPKEIMAAEHEKGLKEQDVRVKILTELHPRECLVRVLANGQVLPAVKTRTLDVDSATEPLLQPVKALARLPGKFRQPADPTHDEVNQQHAKVEAPAARSSQPFNLSDLLAQHSSSRLNVSKRKDQS